MTLTPLDAFIFVAFLVAVVTVGLVKSRGERDSQSYFLAGRALSGWVIGISLIAANISTEQFVGMIGQAASYQGLAPASYDWIAAISLVILAIFVLPYFLRTGIYTMPEFLEKRYSRWARLLMAICTVPVLVLLAACVIYAGALTLQTFAGGASLFGIVPLNLVTASWLLGVLAAVYVTAGGLKSCAWADVIQGTALIVGGFIITGLAFSKLGGTPVSDLHSFSAIPETLHDTAGGVTKFFALNSDKMHVVLPASDRNIPWTALVFGLWIPNLYYWGLNQYITQRTLGSKSLAEGQKGMVMAAGIQVVLPLILVVPGMIAFNLFARDMQSAATIDSAPILASYYRANPESQALRVLESPSPEQLAALPPDTCAIAVFADSAGVASVAQRVNVFPIQKKVFEKIQNPGQPTVFRSEDRLWARTYPSLAAEMDSFNQRVEAAARGKTLRVEKPVAFKYDTAFGLLCSKVLPAGIGLQGLVMAAILGAILSSLAAMLNAASTIASLDLFKQHIRPQASERSVVTVGRALVIAFMIIGCWIAPELGNPKISASIFRLIQELQGYISPGIVAVFAFGLLNRRAPRWTGLIGLILNPLLYGGMSLFWGDRIAFLDRMAISFAIVISIMWLVSHIKPLPQPVTFQTNTSINLESSPAAKLWGGVIVMVTLLLYVIFR